MNMKSLKRYDYLVALNLLLGIYFPCQAETQISAGSLFFGQQSRESIPKEKEMFSKSSDAYFLFGLTAKKETESIHYDLNMELGMNGSRKHLVYARENAYVQWSPNNFGLMIGRKEQTTKNIFPGWKDGLEGIGFFYNWNEKWKLCVQALDYYRGYPLLEKEFLLEEFSVSRAHRFRHGLELEFKSGLQSYSFGFQYLNLGNWGKFSEEVIGNQSGDRDFLYQAKLSYQIESKFFTLGIQGFLVRGLDKTQSHEIRRFSSLPISGEAISLNLGFKEDIFYGKLRGFLPDRHKVNEQGEILETGFIGMGTYPFRGFLLGQIMNFNPAPWVKNSGLLMDENFRNGYQYSFLGEWELGIQERQWSISVFGTTCIPYHSNGSIKGTIRANRKDFSRLFLQEWGIEFNLNPHSEQSFFFTLQISHLVTSKEIGQNSTGAFLKGGIRF
jgi:hypothetical protein